MSSCDSHAGTPGTVACPMCGNSFTCGLSATCWCATKVVPEEVRKYLAERYESCICSECLERLAADHAAGRPLGA